jgi:hypothetical protein
VAHLDGSIDDLRLIHDNSSHQLLRVPNNNPPATPRTTTSLPVEHLRVGRLEEVIGLENEAEEALAVLVGDHRRGQRGRQVGT